MFAEKFVVLYGSEPSAGIRHSDATAERRSQPMFMLTRVTADMPGSTELLLVRVNFACFFHTALLTPLSLQARISIRSRAVGVEWELSAAPPCRLTQTHAQADCANERERVVPSMSIIQHNFLIFHDKSRLRVKWGDGAYESAAEKPENTRAKT